MDVNEKLINELQDNTGRVKDDIETVNKSLKKIVTKLRSPRKLICDILLIVVLAIMIGTLVWAIRFYNSLELEADI